MVSEKVTFLGVEGFGGFERGSKGVEGLESVGESNIFKSFSFCLGILHNYKTATGILALTNQLPKSKPKSVDLLASFGIVTLGVLCVEGPSFAFLW